MVGFASTLGTTSVSIPNRSCFAPTVASQATFAGAGAGYHAREFGMDRESGSWNASRSAFGILQVQEVHIHMPMAKRRRTNVNTPNGAVGRVLHFPPLAGRSRSAHQLYNSPEDVDPSDYSCHCAPPTASASILLLHSHRGRVRTAP